MKNIHFLLIISFLLISCGGLKDAGKVLRNEKITNTDEFLVKKKEPLIIPPDIDIVPEPQSIKNKKQTKDEKIKDILKLPQSSMNKKNTNSCTENSIINRIRK